ncbi:MAG TPA: TIGR03618 family F420-dependent PPOX class oxidoreductase [Acidimicrobiales bacterium]|nr:TIGR03618 family F420-dependent PPOX class oxidoreductase [Acidimicrobiales bacterium]
MKRRDQIGMSEEEIAAFLAEPHTLQVATINRDGTPHLVAMYYAVIGGRVAFWTYGKSQKVKNLERDPRLTVMAEAGKAYGELRGVQITGRAEVSSERDTVVSVGEALYPRYFGVLDGPAKQGVEASGRKRVAVFVNPEEMVSWDHRKLGSTY